MKILVAIDGSEASLDAARHALQLARDGLRADIVLATVQEPTYLYEMVLATIDRKSTRLNSSQ